MSIALSKEKVQAKTGMTIVYSYLVLFFTNSLVIFLANLLFPANIVLGTYALTPMWSLYLAVIELTILGTMVIPLVYYHQWQRGVMYSTKEWMLVYFVVNTTAIWGIARFADKIGFGISAWYVAILLGAALDWIQGIGMMLLAKFNK